MTKRTLVNAMVATAFFTLAACGQGGSTDTSSEALSDKQTTQALADDQTEEQAFNADEQSENGKPEEMIEEQVSEGEISTMATRAAVLAKYDYVDPGKVVPSTALGNALVYFEN